MDDKDLRRFIDSIISIDGQVFEKLSYIDDFKLKIDVLERVIEMARFTAKYDHGNLSLDSYLNLDCRMSDRHMAISQFGNRRVVKSYKKPEDLETPLLVYLLLNYNRGIHVLGLIEEFIKEMRAHLGPFDFDKTATGVTRCYTNTRFAARRLRENGLLEFTQAEAYKTWKLSFLGVITAGLFYNCDWRDNSLTSMKSSDSKQKTPLWWKLWVTVHHLSTNIEVLISSVNFLCEKGKIDDKLKGKLLSEIVSFYGTITDYSKIMKSSTLSEKDKIMKSQEFVNAAHKMPSIMDFMNTLSLNFEKQEFLNIVTLLLR